MESVLYISYCIMAASTVLTVAEDFCKWQKFHPSCGKDEVILIERALFGRMHAGTCNTGKFGNTGCRADVTTVAQTKCAGRTSCKIIVPDEDMDAVPSDCPHELLKYLSITHSCLKVVQPNDTQCNLFTKNLGHGFIASVTTDVTGCGKTNLPWRIKALPGQIINVTLHDFTHPIRSGCQVYATLKEKLPGRYDKLCGGQGPIVPPYLSTSHEIEVRLQTGSGQPKRNFLLEFEVLGCPEMKPPENGWQERLSRDLVHVGCLNSDRMWSFKCVGHKWHGDYPTCNEALLDPTADATHYKVNTPFSVIIVVCVALMLGLSILVTGICILKRKNHPYARAGPRANPPGGEKDMPPSYYGTAPPSYYSARNMTPDHEYEYVSDIIQPNSLANTNPTTTGSAHVTSEMTAGYTGTGYGTVPPAQNAQLVIKGGTSVAGNEYVSETAPFPCPKYFELDTSQPSHRGNIDNTYKSLHHCAHNSKQQFGHYSQ